MRLIIEGFLVVWLFGCLSVSLSGGGWGWGWLVVVVFFASLRLHVFRSWSFLSVFSCRLTRLLRSSLSIRQRIRAEKGAGGTRGGASERVG